MSPNEKGEHCCPPSPVLCDGSAAFCDRTFLEFVLNAQIEIFLEGVFAAEQVVFLGLKILLPTFHDFFAELFDHLLTSHNCHGLSSRVASIDARMRRRRYMIYHTSVKMMTIDQDSGPLLASCVRWA